MFEFMLFVAAAIAVTGLVVAYDGSRDVFHPLIFIGPMLAFLYGWMPWRLLQNNALDRFFDVDQLKFVQTLNILGVLAFVVGCLIVGVRLRKRRAAAEASRPKLTQRVLNRLLLGSLIVGGIGFGCWAMTIINVGGFTAAFSSSYSGGWDDSGYVRDGSMLLLVGVLLAVTSLSAGGPKIKGLVLAVGFSLPWLASALLMGRRGPTFGFAVICLMGWYFNRVKRPPLLLVAAGGLCLGWFVLFLVTNRNEIYIGSSFDMKTDVSSMVQKPDTGNEYIYGSGAVLSAQKRDHYFWMRRYLAQILVRPVPREIWPTKYEDFGVPELLYNAGTGEGFGSTLGWEGAVGSAPGIIADFWIEAWWLAVPMMFLVGMAYGWVWKRAVLRGGPWATQFVIMSALSIYLVMQTGEAVIFRTLLLSIPAWLAWTYALAQPSRGRRFFPARKRAPLRAPVYATVFDENGFEPWPGSRGSTNA
jgi:hypothetical protein